MLTRSVLLICALFGTCAVAFSDTASANTTTSQIISDKTTTTLLRSAAQATRERRYPAAERFYRDLAALSPETGLPALARFYARTGMTTGVAELTSSAANLKLGPLVRARILLAAGEVKEAVTVLRQPPDAATYLEHTILLSNCLSQLQQTTQAATVLRDAVFSPLPTVAERRDLFSKLLLLGDGQALGSVLPGMVQTLVQETTLSYPEIRDLAWRGIQGIAHSGEIVEFQRQLQSSSTSVNEWLLVLANIRRGDQMAAIQIADRMTSQALTPREKMIWYEESARFYPSDTTRVLPLYEALVEVAPDSDRLRVVVAQLHHKLKNYARAYQFIAPVDPKRLDGPLQEMHARLLPKIAGRALGPSELVKAFTSVSAGLRWEKLSDLAEEPWKDFIETDEHLAVRDAITSRAAETTFTAELYALLASVEGQLRNPPGIIAALEGYLALRPRDFGPRNKIAQVRTTEAYKLGMYTANMTTAPRELTAAADASAKALWEVVKARPFQSEPYQALIDLYKQFGQEERAREVPQFLAENPKATAEEVHFAAYLLATNGYPEDAVPLYERAIAASPENARYKMNYAGALRRLKRFDDAKGILWSLIRNGSHGKQYDTAELYAMAYDVAKSSGRVTDFIGYLKGLIKDTGVAQHDRFLLDAGGLLLTRGHYGEAMEFFAAAARDYRDIRGEALDGMVEVHLASKEFARAESLIREMASEAKNPADAIRAEYNRGHLKLQQGDRSEAIRIWEALAAKYPRETQATKSLLAVARAHIDGKNPDSARKILENYLAMETGDADSEQAAREMLMALTSHDDRPTTR